MKEYGVYGVVNSHSANVFPKKHLHVLFLMNKTPKTTDI